MGLTDNNAPLEVEPINVPPVGAVHHLIDPEIVIADNEDEFPKQIIVGFDVRDVGAEGNGKTIMVIEFLRLLHDGLV